MPKANATALLVTAVLVLSTFVSLLQINNADANINPRMNGVQLNYGALGLSEHKITSNELLGYRNSIGTYGAGHNYSQILDGHGTGLRPPTTSEWTDIAENGYIVDSVQYQATLPVTVDLSKSSWFPPIGDQGQQGSCAFFADVYYAKTYQEAKEHQWNLSKATWVGRDYPKNINGYVADEYQNRIMSPAFVYNLMNNATDFGGSLEGPIMAMCSVGVCTWLNMPYNQSNYTDWPSEAAWTQAPYYRSDSSYLYQYIYANQTDGISNLKNWLAAGNVATFAIDANDNINNIPKSNTQDLITLDRYKNGPLDHAQTIVGYDDSLTYMENGTLHSGAFKIVNSWGVGGWENVPDGCYWMSYGVIAELSATGSPVVLSQDLTGYQPQILASFNINHPARGDCKITFGLGTPDVPVATKTFDQYISGGDLFLGGELPFPTNNIVLDLTEFKDHITCLYNQPFFMQIYDGGAGSTGTVNYFAVEGTASKQTPTQTIQGQTVTLTLQHSFAPPILTLTPNAGPPSGEITLTGVGFTGSPIDISYLNPATQGWVTLAENMAIPSMNFTYSTHAPDLQQNNPAGDTSPVCDSLVFRVHDSGSGNLLARAVSSTRPRSLTKISTADNGV